MAKYKIHKIYNQNGLRLWWAGENNSINHQNPYGKCFIGDEKHSLHSYFDDQYYKAFTGILKTKNAIVLSPTSNNDTSVYLKNGIWHREDGSTYIDNLGNFMYALDGIFLSFEDYWNKQKDTIHAPKIMAERLGYGYK